MNTVNKLYLGAKVRMQHFLHDERGEVNIVATVVLCGVAVFLAIIFRNQIGDLIESVIGSIKETATEAVKDKAPSY